MEKSGYGKDGIYRSLRPRLIIPTDQNLSMVPFLFRNSSSYPQALAIADADTGESLTFAAFKSSVDKVARGLLRLGIAKGDVVLIFAPNSLYYPLCFFGTVALGAIATTANPLYTPNELSKQAVDSRPKLIITIPQLWDKVKDLRLPAVIIGSRNHSPPIVSDHEITYFKDLVSGPLPDLPSVPVRQSDTAALLYSSGTTGISKGVILTHRNFISAALMASADQENDGEGRNTFLCFLPMFHIFGLAVITYAQLQRGNSLVTMGRFDMDAVMKAIEKYRVTYMFVVPPVMIALAKQSTARKYDLSSLKRLGSGAAPLGKDIMEACAKNLPHAIVVQGYGLTESCGIVSLENPKGGIRHYGSTGTLVPAVESKIVSVDTLKPLPPNQLGEIWLRGPNMMQDFSEIQQEIKPDLRKWNEKSSSGTLAA